MPERNALFAAAAASGLLELDRRQYRMVLQTIAQQLSALDRLLMAAQASDEAEDASAMIDAAKVIAVHLGAMADAASGGTTIGSLWQWHSPQFYGGGKEANHG